MFRSNLRRFVATGYNFRTYQQLSVVANVRNFGNQNKNDKNREDKDDNKQPKFSNWVIGGALATLALAFI